MQQRGKRQWGLTLVEVMVVVAVLAILSAIAYPLYTDQVHKTRRNDARNALAQIALAQERYYTVNGQYTAAIKNDLVSLPTFLRDGDTREQFYTIGITVPAGNAAYTLTATPVAGKGQSKDKDCTSLTLDQTGYENATGDDPDKCW